MDRYLRRIGSTDAPRADLDTLRALHVAHLRRVPFENLDIHLGVPIVLELSRIVAKIVDQHRGGFCYELNGAFATLLVALGFDVSMHEARVYDGDELGIPFDHMCLRVDLDRPYLVDVGFGECFEEPLLLEANVQQDDPAGTFEIVDAPNGDLDLLQDGSPVYRFNLVPRSLEEFEDACSFHQRSPDSHFTTESVCSMLTPGGRTTIRDSTLIETGSAGKVRTEIPASGLRSAYRTHFGIELAASEIERLVARDASGGHVAAGCAQVVRRHHGPGDRLSAPSGAGWKLDVGEEGRHRPRGETPVAKDLPVSRARIFGNPRAD